MKRTKIYWPLLFITLIFSLPAVLEARDTKSQLLLRRQITFIMKRSNTPRTIKAIEIYSRKHKRVIYQSYSDLLLRPASNLKIVTTSFALHSLGNNYEFKTRFGTSGVHGIGTIEGDLIVTAGGDPLISHTDLDSAAEIISKSDIKEINGDLVIDVSKFDSLQWGSGWMWDDEPESYAMFISPACLDHNAIEVNISVDAATHKLITTTQPQTDFVKIISTAVPDIVDSLFVTRVMLNDVNTILVGGKYSPQFQPSEHEFSMRHPAQYFGTVFKEMLEKHGVKLHGNVAVTSHHSSPDTITDLFTLEHSIDTVITYTDKVSDNLGAECLLREVPSAESRQAGGAENGINLEKEFLNQCGIDSTEYYIVDGSGVSHYDLITPEAIVKVLNYELNQPTKSLFVNCLPIGGVDGTLKKRMKEKFLIGKVKAKTGSISGVSTLSGYVVLPRDTLVFSMMMQNFIADSDSMRALQDSLCSVLALYDDNVKVFIRHLKKNDVGTYGAARHQRISHTTEAGLRTAKKKRSSSE